MALPSNKIKKVKLPNNTEYEIIPERLQGTDDKYSFSVGQSLKSNSTRIYFDRNYESNLISLLQGLTYSSSNPLNIPICNLMTITNPNYGSASYYLLAVDLTSQNLGYCLATFDDYSASSTYHLTVRYGTVAGSGYGMTWTQGYNNLDGSDGFYFVGEDLATCTVASLSSGSSWNGSIIYSDEGTSSGSGNKYEAKLPPLSHDSVIALQSDIKNSTITLTQGGVTKGSFTLNQNSDATISLDAGGGSIDYDELIHKPIINLTGGSSADPFYTGQSVTMGTDRIYFKPDSESELTSWLNSLSGDDYLVQIGNDTGLYYVSDGSNKLICCGTDKNYVLFATGSGTYEGESYTQGFNNLDSNNSFGWIEPMPSEYIGHSLTISNVMSGDWNGSLIACSSNFGSYDEGVYYKMPDEDSFGKFTLGEELVIGDKIYFDKSKESELLSYIQSVCPISGWVFFAMSLSNDSGLTFMNLDGSVYGITLMERYSSTPVYLSQAFQTFPQGWQADVDENGGVALQEAHSVTRLDGDAKNGILFGKFVQSSGAIYRCVNGSLKKVLNEGDVEAPVQDVQVNGTSILSSGVANLVTETAYDASSNKIATVSDLPDISIKMDKSNPTGTGALSLNRKADTTVGSNSVAIGLNGTASAGCSYAEGQLTSATAWAAHAEGYGSSATKSYAHAEGTSTTASGETSHAEGSYTTASGYAAHAEGSNSTASGNLSHAEGSHTTAQRKSQHVFGEYNILDTGGTGINTRGTYVEIVGNGDSAARSNARTLDWNGNEVLAGGLTIGASATLSDGTNSVAISDIAKTSDLTNVAYKNVNNNFSTSQSMTSAVLSNGTPLQFTGYGTGTYNRGAFVCNTTDKFGVECPRETDSGSGNIVPFRVGVRGGQLGNLQTGSVSLGSNSSTTTSATISYNTTTQSLDFTF